MSSHDKSNQEQFMVGGGMPPKSATSPIYNFKQKEKENVAAKKELFGDKRSGSARRTAYLNSNKQ